MLRGIVLSLLFFTILSRFTPDATPETVNHVDSTFSLHRRQTSNLLKSPTNLLSLTVCLLLSGDIEQNPGPQSIYLCAICDLEVTWSCKAICCDECKVWIHHSCVDINSIEYSLMGRTTIPWLCPRCDSVNCDTFTFNSFELSCHNTYEPLSAIQTLDSVDSFSSNDIFSPKRTSSPVSSNNNRQRIHSSHSKSSKRSTRLSSIFDLPNKSNLRVLNVNCRSIKQKRSEFLTALEYIKPDIVCGVESWLTGVKPGKPQAPDAIATSEIFPDDYNVYRNDRNSSGGGVFIMTHKSLTVEEKPDLVTECEINWVKLKLQNHKDQFIGVFYMPHRNDKDVKQLRLSLDKLTASGAKDTNIILAGDFNSPDINWENHTVSNNATDRPVQELLADVASSFSLTQIHNHPTRLSNILDLIFTTNPSLAKNSSSIPGISDHDMVVADFLTKPQVSKEHVRKTFKFHKANWDNINKDLEVILQSLKLLKENSDPDKLWLTFKEKLNETLLRNIPQGTGKKLTKLPWINRNILRLLRKKKKLYRQARETKCWNLYQEHQRLCKREIRKAEWQHINRTIQEGLQNNNTKPFWNFVKARRRDNIGVSPLRENGRLFSEASKKANILLNQFKSVFTIDDSSFNLTAKNQVPNCKPITIDTKGVAKLLKNLQPHKASGPDCIPNTVLKTCADNIAPILTIIFQKSLDSGSLPTDWLIANISSAFKKGDRHAPENYRPISLTSVSCKILEHIICRHLLFHFEENNILTNLNHGFRSGYSCETQLLTTAQDLLNSFDNGKQIDIAILDFSKAFDTVPHKKLLFKLSEYGIKGSTLQWLECFLTQRTMRVVIEGIQSEATTVDSGVPQGTVLGPLLFLCHINNLPECVSSQVRLFADDCLLYREISTFNDHVTLQKDLKNLEDWADLWGMRFNATKCYILSISNKTSFNYQLNNTILKTVSTNPYLGILFSNDLKWSNHISKISKKANSTIGFLQRNLKNCPQSCKRMAYLSLVRSVIEYGAILWDPYLQKDVSALEQVQRRALRFISGDYKTRSAGFMTKLQQKYALPNLQDRRKALRLTFMYKIVEGLVPAIPPEQFINFNKPGRQIRPNRKFHNYDSKNTIDSFIRNNSKTIKINIGKTEQYKNSFFNRTAIDWNSLDDSIVKSKTLESFKTQINKNLKID